MSTASNPIMHHTSHTMGNGASSSNGGSNGNGGAASVDESHDHVEEPVQAQTSLPPPLSSFGHLQIVDSTLREGEQFATAYFTTAQKLAIAKTLDKFGVEYIEVTSPVASAQSRIDCEAICKLGLKAKILTHTRCNIDDVKVAVQTGVDGINVCIGTSSHLMEHSHKKDLEYIANTARKVITYVKSCGLEIRFSGEDSFRSDFSEILKLYSAVDKMGVNRVGIADTVGGATPMEVSDKVAILRQTVGCDIETHFHNDTGCAIGNAFCALESGATHVDTTVLGIGERNGITPLGGLIACLSRFDPATVARYNLNVLDELQALVSHSAAIEVPFNAFIVLHDAEYKCAEMPEEIENEISLGYDNTTILARGFGQAVVAARA